MNKILIIGGPLVVVLAAWFLVASGVVVFGEVPNEIDYQVDVQTGETSTAEEQQPTGYSQSANYRLEEQSTGFADVNGLSFEQESIEYRDGTEAASKTKQPGLTKFTNITVRRPKGVDWENWRFVFEEEVEVEAEDEVEMIQINPPTLVIPAQ